MDEQAAPTRRRLLQVGLIGGVVLAAGGIGLQLQSSAPSPVPDELAAFSPRAFRVLTAVADTICPGDGASLPKASELDVPATADAYVATLHPTDRQQLEQALQLLESPLAGLFLDGRARPFSRLDAAARAGVLEAWRSHRLGLPRSIYVALRNLVMTTYHVHPRVYAAIGYPGPPDYRQSEAPAIQPRQPSQEETG